MRHAVRDDLRAAMGEAVVDPSQWGDVLQLVADRLDAVSFGIMHSNSAGTSMAACSRGTQRSALASYGSYYRDIDPVPAFAARLPNPSVASLSDFMSRGDRQQHEFFADWAIPQNMDEAFFGVLGRAGQGAVWFCAPIAARKSAKARQETRNGVTETVADLRIFYALSGRFRDIEAQQRASRDAQQALPFALIRVDHRLRITDINAAAQEMLQCGSLVVEAAGRLRCTHADDRRNLFRAVASAISPDCPAATQIVCHGDPALLLEVLPVPGPDDPCAMVILRRADTVPQGWMAAFAERYRLTAAEARVATLCGTGLGLREVARRLDISHATARVHLQRVFDKTGLHSQAALAAHLGRL